MLPRKLKAMNLFNNGISYLGEVEEIKLPDLTRKMEDWRGAGMNAPIKTDQGMEALTMGVVCGGLMIDALTQFGALDHDGVMLRYAGEYQRDDTGETSAVEVVVRGRHSSVKLGSAKPGEGGSTDITTEISYYKLTIDGNEIIEIDILNMVEKYNGEDRLAGRRANIGL